MSRQSFIFLFMFVIAFMPYQGFTEERMFDEDDSITVTGGTSPVPVAAPTAASHSSSINNSRADSSQPEATLGDKKLTVLVARGVNSDLVRELHEKLNLHDVYPLCTICKGETTPVNTNNDPLKFDSSWKRFDTTDFEITAVAGVSDIVMLLVVPPPTAAHWNGPILFDKSVGNALALHSESEREDAKTMADSLAYGMVGYALLDGPAMEMFHGNKDEAEQLFGINGEAMALSDASSMVLSRIVDRKRPPGATCGAATDGWLVNKYDPNCDRSFPSGHTENAFTAASLICTEHGIFGFYGGYKDKVTCIAAMAGATVVGVLRVASENHYPTDVLAGAALGLTIGYVVPNYMHFNFGKRTDQNKSNNSTATLVPIFAQSSGDGREDTEVGMGYKLTWSKLSWSGVLPSFLQRSPSN